jgi:hypothetical protein
MVENGEDQQVDPTLPRLITGGLFPSLYYLTILTKLYKKVNAVGLGHHGLTVAERISPPIRNNPQVTKLCQPSQLEDQS